MVDSKDPKLILPHGGYRDLKSNYIFSEDDLLQLSALQHFVFCKRQCALIHIEQIWFDNLFTAEGRILHEKAHEETIETRKDLRIERGVPIRSLELGLSGKADVVEYHRDRSGTWIPFPVEYKRGKPKVDECDKVQLCAQALCLEETIKIEVLRGAIFYGKNRRRLDVEFNEEMRSFTRETAAKLHEFIREGITPKPIYNKKCDSCSFIDFCLPNTLEKNLSIERYLQDGIR